MHSRRIAGIIVSLLIFSVVLWIGLFFLGQPVRAQQTGAPRSDYVNALWVVGADEIIKIASADGTIVFAIPSVQGVHAVAVDERRGVLWAYGDQALQAYSFSGTFVRSVPLSQLSADDEHNALVINADDGTVWLGVHMTLLHLDPQGQVLRTISLAENVQALALDKTAARLWVGTQKTVSAYNGAGSLVASIQLGKDPDVAGLAVDAGSGALWIALQKTLRRYDANGVLQLETAIATLQHLASDGQGGVWIATDKDLRRLDQSGRLLFTLQPFAGSDIIVALVVDPADRSAWVASHKALVQVSAQGLALQHLTFNGSDPDLRLDGSIQAVALYADVIPPTLAFTAPNESSLINTNTPAIKVQYSDIGSGVDATTLRLQANGQALQVTCTRNDSSATCTPTAALAEGRSTLSATVADHAGNTSKPATVSFTVDTIPPRITLNAPRDGTLTNQAQQTFVGSLSEAASLTLNGAPVSVGSNNTFSHGPVLLREGLNTFVLIATDAAGNSSRLSLRMTLDTVPPAAVNSQQVQVSSVTGGQVQVSGKVGSVEAGARVKITNTRTGQIVMVLANADGSFTATIAAQSGDTLSFIATDAAGNASTPSTLNIGSTLAPPLDRTVATDLASATAFLYTGSQPVQTGVAAGTIEPRRATVLRGQVRTRDGAPLGGVSITIVGHREYGSTLTRTDGLFDMAVNGGGFLTVRYEKAPYLPVQRQVQTPWQDYIWLPDVVMVPYDAQRTTIALTAATGIQVAQGSVQTDADGTRQATLLFVPGTQATMVLPDGSSRALTTLGVRATEYTVGPNGPAAMPAALPPTSAYTYAVELSADEAVAAGAAAVQFTQAVILYVENFLRFPVGEKVPVGYYDQGRGTWVPSQNGRIIKIVSRTAGLADLDIDGDGVPDSAVALAALGINDAERQRLATLYQNGQSLWRLPITHFSAWDANWGWGPPADAKAPDQPDPADNGGVDNPSCKDGSIIECQNQTLGEVVSLVGTPFNLHYRSDRVPGRTAANTLQIPLSGPQVPAGVKRIELAIEAAGRRFTQTFTAAPNQTATFTWDGQDAYGRTVQGSQPITVHIGYLYNGTYQRVERFGYTGNGIPITADRTRQEISLGQRWQGTIGPWDARSQSFGGWTLHVHHAYDPVGRVLYLGDGGRRSAHTLGQVITTVAGNGLPGFSGDGGLATQAQLGGPRGIAVAPDGSFYITGNRRIRRISPDGIITTVAGNGVSGSSGDGGPATQAQLDTPAGVAMGPDGSFYIADPSEHNIRRVDPNGIITTVAGAAANACGSGADGGPATQARLCLPFGVAVSSDGSLYIADTNNGRIRRVSPDGIITTVAGGGISFGDGGPATQAQLGFPTGLTIGPDGSVYIADPSSERIRRVGPNGIITTVAGHGPPPGYSGDGGPATQAQLDFPSGVAIGSDGSLYIVDSNNSVIRRVDVDGIITTVAGNAIYGYSGDGGPATQAQLYFPWGIATGPDGNLYIADLYNVRIRRVEPPLPGFSTNDILIPAEDGSEVYVFDERGQHQRTLHGLTGALRYQFGYDSAGRLTTVTDGDGNVTTIERDARGNATTIVAPFGQRTALSLDANGYLASVTNPAREVVALTYSGSGLLTALTTPRGTIHRFSYDALGRLLRDTDPAGGFTALARTDSLSSYTATLTSALNRVSTYLVEQLAVGGTRRVDTDPAGLQTVTRIDTGSTRTTTSPAGMTTTLVQGPDPRFGMQAPVSTSVRTATPAGLTSTLTATRTVTLADPHNPLSLTRVTDTVTVNGRRYTSTFDAASRQLTDTTPVGRQRLTTLDTQGRVVAEQLAGLAPRQFAYDINGRLTTITQGTRTAVLAYDAQGALASLTDPLARAVHFAYDTAGRLTRQTLPDGREVLYSYDANGNLTALTPPSRPNHAFTYTPVDLQEDYVPPDVRAGTNLTHYAYNLDRQLIQVTRPDSTTLSLGYDAAGRLSTLTLPRGQVRYAYDAATGNLATLTAPDGVTLTYGYDGSLLTDTTWSGAVAGSIHRTYDQNFRLTSESVNGGHGIAFQYDQDGLLIGAGALQLSRDLHNGLITGSTLATITDTRTYNSFGELDSSRATVRGSDVFVTVLARDDLGRITQKTETIDGQTSTFTYAYDLAGRLIGVTRNNATIATYTYDANGNRLSYSGTGGPVNGSYDAQDRLTQYGPTTYTYTANGELLSKTTGGQTTTYVYDALGNLLAVTLPDGTRVEYVVDGQQRRVGKKVNGTLVQGFLYTDALRPVAELDASGTMVARFIYGATANVPEYMEKNGATYRILSDHLGSPRLVIDATTGAVVQRLDYDAFGQVRVDTHPGFQPFGFAGGLYDQDTKLNRFGARDYDAVTGRWTTKDPILFLSGDTNVYGYVLNDPVNGLDLTGLVKCNAEQNHFFEELLDPVKRVANQYGFDPNFLLGLAAHESGWLGEHAQELNNVFGVTLGGGPNLQWESLADAVAYWGRTYGSKVQGAKSIDDFINKLQTDQRKQGGLGKYNTQDRNWATGVRGAYKAVVNRRGICPCER